VSLIIATANRPANSLAHNTPNQAHNRQDFGTSSGTIRGGSRPNHAVSRFVSRPHAVSTFVSSG
jgi:hypothetical protein